MTKRRFYSHWWTALPSVPAGPDTLAYRRLMRVFLDHTVGPNQSAYNPNSERHIVVSFFENFTVDTNHLWVRALATRLGMLRGEISDARWSYEYEDGVAHSKRDGLGIADLVICWKDDVGYAVIVVEAKRPGGIIASGISAKDDPTRGAYLAYHKMCYADRRKQMLLVSDRDLARLPVYLLDDPRIITWEALAATQIGCLFGYGGSRASEMIEALSDHHRLLGIAKGAVSSSTALPTPPTTEADQWLSGYRSFALNRTLATPITPMPWLSMEPDQWAMRTAKLQSTPDREATLWRCP